MTVAPHVGAMLETVAPRKVTDSGDRLRLGILLLVAVAIHGWLLAHTYTTARDSIEFARIALQLQNPQAASAPGEGPVNVGDILRKAKHPPGYPLAVLAVSSAVRPLYHAPLPDQMLLSAQLTTAIAGVLLAFPTYWLGRFLFGKFAGFAAALLFQVLPVAAHVTSDGLTEGPYLLTMATALLLGVRAIKKPGIGGFLLCGLATGASYLCRPEGLVIAAAVGVTAVVLGAVRTWPRRAALARCTALAVGAMIPAAPYMVIIGGITNKPTGNAIFERLMGNPKEKMWKGDRGAAPAADGPLFAAWYEPETDGAKPIWVVKTLLSEGGKTFHYGTGVLALFGLAMACQRCRAEPWLAVPLLAGVANFALIVALGWKIGYLSERHTLPVVFIGCIFAAGWLAQWPEWAARRFGQTSVLAGWRVPIVALIVLVLSCLPPALKPLHENRVGHKHAGRYLADVLQPEDTLVDPFEWAKFYSGRSLYRVPTDQPNPKLAYAVIEASNKDESPHSRLDQMPDALNIARDGRSELVYWWPEVVPKEAAKEKAKVLVYRLER